MNIVEIFVNTWGNYNNFGCDGGRWITLPMDADDLKRTLADIAARYFDYKSFARDLGFEGYTETSKGVVFCA